MSELNIPDSWAEINWDDIIEIQGGSQPPKSTFSDKPKKGFIRLLQIRDFASDKDAVYIPLEKANKTCVEDDVLIGRYGASIGRICTGKAGAYNVALAKVIYPKDSIIKPFLEYHLRAPEFQKFITNIGGRAAQAGFNKEDLSSLPFPLPPVLEQERIVQKIESCFSKIEETEQNLNKVEVLLEKYRESLMAKAFRGELIPQNPDDEPANMLLAKIRDERAQNKKGKKKEQEFFPISDDEKPFDIPESWEWVKIGDLSVFSQGIQVDVENQLPEYFKGAERFLRIIDYTQGIDEKRYIEDLGERYKVKKDDLVMVRYGATTGFIGRGLEGIIANNLFKIDLPKIGMLRDWLFLIFKSNYFKQFVRDNILQAAMPAISHSVLNRLAIPLPPVQELNSLVSLIQNRFETLEALISTFNRRKKLLEKTKEAILSKAFEGRLVEQIESEGSGHELLQKILEQIDQEISAKESTKKKTANRVSKKKSTKN